MVIGFGLLVDGVLRIVLLGVGLLVGFFCVVDNSTVNWYFGIFFYNEIVYFFYLLASKNVSRFGDLTLI